MDAKNTGIHEMRNKMKKWIVLLLAAVMCLSLCACGASGKTNSSDASNGIIEFENTIVADDVNVTIELVNFYPRTSRSSLKSIRILYSKSACIRILEGADPISPYDQNNVGQFGLNF